MKNYTFPCYNSKIDTGESKFVISLTKPNICSFMFLLITAKILIVPDVGERNLFDYLIWGFSVFFFLFNYSRKRITDNEKRIFKSFGFLFLISCLGMIQNFTFHSITSVIGVFCIGCYVLCMGFVCKKIQFGYIKLCSCLILLSLFQRTLLGVSLGNSLPGILCFITFAFSIVLIANWKSNFKEQRAILLKLIDIFVMLAFFVLSIYISWKSAARTAVFTEIGVLIVFLLLQSKKPSFSNYNKMFWFLVIFILLCTYVYMNVTNYSWYKDLNMYSVSSFQKQVASERPDLWNYSLSQLKWWQVIIGAGTGKLPTYIGYEGSSFHSVYIQLLMQNGILGLGCLISIFKAIWDIIAKNENDITSRLLIACFIGIMIYNTFECTLLQNKAFMGLIEWSVLCFGIINSRKMNLINSEPRKMIHFVPEKT